MCLIPGFRRYRDDYATEGMGYKIMTARADGLTSLFVPDAPVFSRFGEWQKATHRIISVPSDSLETSPLRSYLSGFHVYLETPAFTSFRSPPVVKVRWRGLLAKGFDAGLATIVAREMCVTEIVTKHRPECDWVIPDGMQPSRPPEVLLSPTKAPRTPFQVVVDELVAAGVD